MIIPPKIKPNNVVTQDVIDCWRTTYNLKDREPSDAASWWATHYKGAPAMAVAALGTALQEIERLQTALRYEENRFSRIGTHAPDCHKWGPGHYECALRKIKELEDSTENWSAPD